MIDNVSFDTNNVTENYAHLSQTHQHQVLTNSLLSEPEIFQSRKQGQAVQNTFQDQDSELFLGNYCALQGEKQHEGRDRQILEPGALRNQICRDQELYKYLENEKRQKDKEIKELTSKLSFGFKPVKTKKTF